jgi:ABC-type transport system involved in multi-copper enzyme maturation permease subunit
MNFTITRQMIAAEVLKLRRSRGTMVGALLLSVGIVALYFAVSESRHNGTFGGAEALTDGVTMIGTIFGALAAILIGTEAGTADLTSGVFRDLVATGRSRTALFLVRIPAAVAVAVASTLSAYLITVVVAIGFSGPAPAPGLGFLLRNAGWVVLATAVTTALAVSVSSFSGSRPLTLTALIGLQLIGGQLVLQASFLGSARDLVLVGALAHLRPGPHGTAPGFNGNLQSFDELSMAAAVAIAVILAWTVIPALAAGWRTVRQEA